MPILGHGRFSAEPTPGPIRVVRVIARMNVGGPAYHVSLLSGRLDPKRYTTLLVAGEVGRGEASLEHLAERYGARLQILPALGPDLRPIADARALRALVRLVRSERPHILHTHTAKAGLLGRLAALLARRPRPVVVHTFHGHVLEGYFGRSVSLFYRVLEWALAHVSDCLICVSEATADDLVRLGVAPRAKFRVIPLGLELDRFLAVTGRTESIRRDLGVVPDQVLLLYAGRLVPVKRVDRILRAVADVNGSGADVVLAVAGDGRLRVGLERLAADLGISDRVHFLGYRSDLPALTAAADIAVLSSANEGTPVFLIEAAAAGRPAISTNVGGVGDVVLPSTGVLVGASDEKGFATAISHLAGDEARRFRAGSLAREHVRERYDWRRLMHDTDELYGELLRGREERAPI